VDFSNIHENDLFPIEKIFSSPVFILQCDGFILYPREYFSKPHVNDPFSHVKILKNDVDDFSSRVQETYTNKMGRILVVGSQLFPICETCIKPEIFFSFLQIICRKNFTLQYKQCVQFYLRGIILMLLIIIRYSLSKAGINIPALSLNLDTAMIISTKTPKTILKPKSSRKATISASSARA
jgi:hypothetical protein